MKKFSLSLIVIPIILIGCKSIHILSEDFPSSDITKNEQEINQNGRNIHIYGTFTGTNIPLIRYSKITCNKLYLHGTSIQFNGTRVTCNTLIIEQDVKTLTIAGGQFESKKVKIKESSLNENLLTIYTDGQRIFNQLGIQNSRKRKVRFVKIE